MISLQRSTERCTW